VSAKVYVVTGQHATQAWTNAEGSSATNNLTTTSLTTTANGSLLFAVGTEWNALGAGGSGPTSSDLTYDSASYSGAVDAISGYKAVTTSGTAATANLDAAGASAAVWNYCLLEVVAAAGGAAGQPTTRRLSLCDHAGPGRAAGNMGIRIASHDETLRYGRRAA
jgi:hypothetical protein